MADKTIVLITGANSGIGYEAVKALLRSGRTYHVFLSGRDIEKARKAVETAKAEVESTSSSVEPLQLDVESDESVTKAYEHVEGKVGRLDCLINNAGGTFDHLIAQGKLSTREAWNKTWAVNVTGSHVVTETFVPLLLKSKDPRLMFITSGASALEHTTDASNPRNAPPPAGWPKHGVPSAHAYRSSKTGLNMMMAEWGRMLGNDGVKVWAVSPGMLATGLGPGREVLLKMGAGDPAQGGTIIRKVVEGEKDGDVGKIVMGYASISKPGTAPAEGESPVQPW